MAAKKSKVSKKKSPRARRSTAPRRPTARASARPSAANPAGAAGPTATSVASRLDELTETIDIVVPELSARLAALEHLIVERRLCSREDLRRALAFVDMRRRH